MAGSSKAELLLALTAMFAAIVGLVVARLVPSVRFALRLRNAIVHFRPEDRSAEDELNKLQKGLRARGFADNALMVGSGNPWWPDKALGYGAAEWAHRSVQALSDHVSDAIEIVPVYRKVEAGGWFGRMPGERELD